jgi:hypothetical protein
MGGSTQMNSTVPLMNAVSSMGAVTPLNTLSPLRVTPLTLGHQPADACGYLHELVEVALARDDSELIAAFQLLYTSYLNAGLARENASQIRVTPFHQLPTTEVFVAKCSSEIISTLTMVPDGEMGLPLDTMYAPEVAALRQAGLRLAEIGCLADRRSSPVRFVKVFGELARLVVQVASQRGMDALVLAAHPRHAKFYIRSFGFEPFGGLKYCPYAEGNPAVALVLEFQRIRGTRFNEQLFGNPFKSEQLLQTQWSSGSREWLRRLVNQQHPRDASLPAE